MTAALRPRERRLALVAGVLIGCWVFLSWLVQPLWGRVRDLRLRVETQAQKLDGFNRLLARAPSIEREYLDAAPYLQTGDAESAQGALLDELESLSRRASVRLNLKPRPSRQDGALSRFEVELDAEGSQQEVLAFLDALLRLPKLITVERVRIAATPAKPDLLRANLVLQQLTTQ
ncbi:MAG: hypothetical protein HYT90_03095 [Candidatus Omnitrophica bacterium]|nr:hypothetical protein [Candidatus Omnitrophota bacterium]